ncbi:hypothetical protein E2C01_048185 [Portunus trituberculatus]|uniref:Uncharacterized protein n=1 Tax=Portunus trituberculatus TaxID=210409 RepID=A0A5B7GA20_PORTR|nr:hypothetical protein [Portunus trituberculatus]
MTPVTRVAAGSNVPCDETATHLEYKQDKQGYRVEGTCSQTPSVKRTAENEGQLPFCFTNFRVFSLGIVIKLKSQEKISSTCQLPDVTKSRQNTALSTLWSQLAGAR